MPLQFSVWAERALADDRLRSPGARADRTADPGEGGCCCDAPEVPHPSVDDDEVAVGDEGSHCEGEMRRSWGCHAYSRNQVYDPPKRN